MIINIRKLLLYFYLGAITASFHVQTVNATNTTVNSMASLQTALAGSSDTIYVSPSASIYTISSVFTITRNVCIIGQSSGGLEAIIQTTGNFRHFSYNGAYNLELKDLVLIGPSATYAAGVFTAVPSVTNGGGVFAQNGNLKITGCKIAGCQSPGNGGAIEANTTPLIVDNNSVFQFNNANGHGGTIFTDVPLTLENVTIRNSKAGFNSVSQTVSLSGYGGAINASNACTLRGNIILENNEAYNDGGALYKAAPGNLNLSGLTSLTIINNATHTGNGGGIATYAPLTLDNSANIITLSPNTAGKGGGSVFAGTTLTLKNITFANNKAGYNPVTASVSKPGAGGAVEAGGDLFLQGQVAFTGNEAYGDGGAIFKHTAGVFDVSGISTLTIQNNATYTGQGGGICTHATLTLDNTTNNLILSPNTAGAHGGVIAAFAPLVLKNTTISGCKAGYNPNTASVSQSGSGGAIVAHNALTLQGNIVFQNNQAYLEGGAIFKSAPGNFDVTGITNLTIKDNATYTGQGGGICTHATLTLDNTTNNLVLFPNTAGAHGGSIAAIAPLTLKNTTISNCKAGYNPSTTSMSQVGSGGAVISYNALTLEGNIVFQNNQANTDGGAIFKAAAGNFDVMGLTNLILKDNATYTGRGGGIFTSAALILDNTSNNLVLFPNTAGSYGGAIAALAPLTLKNTTISNCKAGYNPGTASLSQAGQGGAVYATNLVTCYGNIVFENNIANNDGGAICLIPPANLDASTHINTFIAKNNKTMLLRGGAIAAFGTGLTVVNISNATFEGNTSQHVGGAIYAYGQVSLSYSTFHNNTSSNNGGGVHKDASSSFTLDVRKCIFSNNSAVNGGGISTAQVSGNTISNTTFSQNNATANGGGFFSSGANASVNMALSTFNGNTSASGATAVHFANSVGKVLNGCLIYGNGTGTELLNPGQSDYNIIRDISLTGTANTNLPAGNGTNIFAVASGDLATLANNGGKTQTLAIKKYGPAYNYIPMNVIQSWETAFGGAGSLASDQCDSLRNGCMADAGAFEVQDEDIPVITLKNNVPVCFGSLLNVDTLIVSATFMNDTIYSSNNLYTDTLSMPITVTTQNRIYVQFTTTSNCKIDTFIDLTINPLPVVTITNANPSLCLNDSLTMTANVSGGTWSNKYSATAAINAATGVVTALSAGIDTIYYNYTNPSGCSASDTTVLTVLPLTVVTITSVNPVLCLNDNTTFTANVTGGIWSSSNPLVATINANTGVTSPVSIGSTQISYTYTNSNGCSATTSTLLIVNDFPSVSLSYQQLLPPEPTYTVQFSGQSTDSILSWSWDFGDGNISTSRNPKHTYSSPMVYTVKLTVVGLSGCPNSAIAAVNLYEKINARFDVNTQSQCLFGNMFVFTNKSTVSGTDATPVSWYWNFGDSSVSRLENPQHTYATAGTYTVELIATTKHGIRDTSKMTVFVALPPKINPVSDETYCNKTSVPAYSFTGTPPNATYKWKWIGGDKLNNIPLSGQNTFPAFQASNQTDTTQIGIYQAWAESNDSLRCPGDSIIFTRSIFPSAKIILTANVAQACPYEESAIFTYTTDQQLPVEYRINFNQHAKNNGFHDIPDTLLSNGNIMVPLPSGIIPGLYNGILYTAIAGCTDSTAYPIVISVTIEEPVITEQPHNIVFCSGDAEIYLMVKSLQEDTDHYQWYKNGTKIDGETQNRYLIPNPSEKDTGIYYAEVTNKCTTVRSNSAQVTKNSFEILTKWNHTVLFVSNVDAQNKLHGYVRYQWYLDEQEIKGAVYQYHEIQEGKAGYYKVRAYRSDNSMDESCPSFHSRGGTAPKFRIYPNPVSYSGNVRIEIEIPQDEKPGFRVELYNLLGTCIINQEIQENSVQLPIHTKPGTYIVRITNSNGVYTTKKLIVSQ